MKMETLLKRPLAALLVMVMLLAMTACGGTDAETGTESPSTSATAAAGTTAATTAAAEVKDPFYVADNDEEIYFNTYGEFYDAYQLAMSAGTVSQRHALLAVAEAKALQAAGGTPMYGPTASYMLSRYVYRSGGYAPWRGGMTDYSQFVITNEIITSEDYAYTQDLYNKLLGTGTYMDKAKEYLASKGYTFTDTITGTFNDNATTWDIFGASSMNDTTLIRPSFDYLYVYDAEGELVPHLATSCKISNGGLTYTIKIREGVSWVDSQCRKVADLTADDWVAAAQHQADMQDCYTLSLYVAGMSDYANGITTDFSTVGVKAVDTYTLEYTLVEPITYFQTMFESIDFLPLSRSYFLSQGGAFGLSEFTAASSATSYVYGIDQNHIAYSGQFLCTNMTEKNSVTYILNESYWGAGDATITYVKLIFDDGSDVARVYDNFKNGITYTLSLNTARMEMAKNNGDYEKYAVVSDVGRATFLFWFNLHRQTYANKADGAAPSLKTAAEKELSSAAFQNQHFRLALAHSIDRASFISVNVGEDLKYLSIRNTMTPGTYVSLEEAATIDINGSAVTFPEGTWYGEIVQAQLDADGFPVTVWDAANKTTDGWDAWYNPEIAIAELQIAIEELAALGYEVSASNPIVIDFPYADYNESGQNQAYVLKVCIESALNGYVRFDLLPLNNSTELQNVMNNTNSGSEVNTDMGGLGTIGSDHGDPQCYTEALLPYGDGYLTPKMGLW